MNLPGVLTFISKCPLKIRTLRFVFSSISSTVITKEINIRLKLLVKFLIINAIENKFKYVYLNFLIKFKDLPM